MPGDSLCAIGIGKRGETSRIPPTFHVGYNYLEAKPPLSEAMPIGMNKDEAIASLKRHAEAIRALGATSLYLFGSIARGEATANSDLDLFVDYDRDGRFNAFDLVGIKLLLEDKLGLQVDVTTRDSLHPMLREGIEQSAARVF
jgi:predicted nucleotidyltransferase